MPSYDGEYAPKDQRDVTLGKSDVPGEPKKSGPREGESRAKVKENADGTPTGETEVDGSGGAAGPADEPHKTAQDAAVPGETAKDPAVRARADAGRPLDGG
ncbi:MAG: hypothetical protein WA908_09610 [Pontixanthobacter sp.]